MFLSELKENQSGVVEFCESETAFGRRLCDMGFRKGERVLCVKRGVFKSPIVYGVCGSLVALRKADADKIEVVL